MNKKIKNIKKNKNIKKSHLELKKEKEEKYNKKIDEIIKKNFTEYDSQEELEKFIENRSKELIKAPLTKINKKEKELSKKIKLKEKENEKKTREKLKKEDKKIKEKLGWYNRIKL